MDAALLIPKINNETEARISALYIREGQRVKAGEPVGRLAAAGQQQDMISKHAGYVVGLHALPGQAVRSGEVLCYICSQPSIPTKESSLPDLMPGEGVFDARSLLIFGGGGHGKLVIDLLRALGTYRIAGVIDDGLPLGSTVMGVPVVGGAADLAEWHDRGVRMAVNAVGGIGNVAVRLKVFDLLTQAGFSFPTIIHPSAVVERSASLEASVHILAHAYVGSDARIGFGTIVNTAAIVHHDCVVGKVVNFSPGATLAGNVRVEDHAQVGMLATVNVDVTIGKGARLGNGCTVKADVPPGGRVRAGAIWPDPTSLHSENQSRH